VRGLEADFGQELVFRAGVKMALTEAGRQLADALNEGFSTLTQGVRDLREAQASQPLKIALTPSFAENWLMPRVGGFWSQHPDIELALHPSGDLVDLKRDGFDLAIRYGHGDWPGYDAQLLVSARYVIVGTRDLIGDVAADDLTELCALPWVFEAGRAEPKLWAAENGLDLSCTRITEFATNALVLSAARSGYGLSIQGRPLIQADLDSGALVCVHQGAPSELGYYIVTRPGVPSVKVKTFTRWLFEVAKDASA
jgi:LysR family glycine cleavage system transcriptional activator